MACAPASASNSVTRRRSPGGRDARRARPKGPRREHDDVPAPQLAPAAVGRVADRQDRTARAATFFSLWSAKKPMKRLSGDQNGQRRVLGARERLHLEPVHRAHPDAQLPVRARCRRGRASSIRRKRRSDCSPRSETIFAGSTIDAPHDGAAASACAAGLGRREARRAASADAAAQRQPTAPAAAEAATGAAIPDCEPPSAIHFSSLPGPPRSASGPPDPSRGTAFTTRSSAGGVIGATAEMGAGSSFMIDEISDAWLAPENAFLPVAISYSTHPNAKMSVRRPPRGPPAAPAPCTGTSRGSSLPASGCSAAPERRRQRRHRRLHAAAPSPSPARSRAASRPTSSSSRCPASGPGARSPAGAPCPARPRSRVPYRSVCSSGSAPLARRSRERLALEQLHDQILDAVLRCRRRRARRCASATAARSSWLRARSAAGPRATPRGAAAGP